MSDLSASPLKHNLGSFLKVRRPLLSYFARILRAGSRRGSDARRQALRLLVANVCRGAVEYYLLLSLVLVPPLYCLSLPIPGLDVRRKISQVKKSERWFRSILQTHCRPLGKGIA